MEKIKKVARMRLLHALGYFVYHTENGHFFKYADDSEKTDIEDISDGTISDLATRVRQTKNPWLAEQFIYSFCPIVKDLNVGNVYWFNYDAKLGEQLEIWDQQPLSIIYESHPGLDGTNYYGCNVHFVDGFKRREYILRGEKLSGKEQLEAFKDYIDYRAYNIFKIQEQWYDIAVYTTGKFINNRR